MNDIEILQEMLSPEIQVILQSGQGRQSVQLTDSRSGSSVEIKGLPNDSIVIRAEDFKNPLTIFNGTKGERKRADFVIVSNDENEKKWLIFIETQEGDSKKAWEIVQQLNGAHCFISYCQCIGKSFWESDEFLEDYEYRFVSIVNINFNTNKRRTEPFTSKGKLHNRPSLFLKVAQRPTIYFRKLINFIP